MQIERKGSGPWPEVKQDGVVVTLSVNGDELRFDCAELQTDGQRVIDVVMGFDGHLAEGTANGGEYVANLVIPPKRYEDVDLPAPAVEMELPDDIDPACVTPAPTTETVAAPFMDDEMEAVLLILWTVNEKSDMEAMF